MQNKNDAPLVSSTKFDVAAVSVGDETDYAGVVGPGANDYLAFSEMPKGRALLVSVSTGALTGTPTGLKFGLVTATAADGTGLAFATATGATTEVDTPAGDSQYELEIPLSLITNSALYYGIGVAVKGGGSTAMIVGTVTRVLDPAYKS